MSRNGNSFLFCISAPVDMLIRIAGRFSVSADYLLGLNGRRTFDVIGLTDEQIAHLQLPIDDLRNL